MTILSRPGRAVRTLFAIAAAVALAAVTIIVEGPVLDLQTATGALLVSILWFGPVVLYWLFVRTVAGSVTAGLALAIGAPVMLREVILTDSSTAGLGVIGVPVLAWVGIVICLSLEVLVTESVRHRRQDGRSPASL